MSEPCPCEESGPPEELQVVPKIEPAPAALPFPDLTRSAPSPSRARLEGLRARTRSLGQRLAELNKELWLILSMLAIAALMSYLATGRQMLLGFYTLPTVFAAYFFGRRHATLAAIASVALIALLARINPNLLTPSGNVGQTLSLWTELITWGGTLIITAYTVGTLYERHQARMRDLRNTYQGILLILRQFISKDKYTENHSYRVSIYSAKIAAQLRLSPERTEDLRAAALLHDIGKLEISRELLHKAASLTQSEYAEMKHHVEAGANLLEPLGGFMPRIVSIILAHHDRFDGSGYHPTTRGDIPLEARIIAVADAYDALSSDRPYRKAMSPFKAKDVIAHGAGTEFDPSVVRAFLVAFTRGEMEIPEIVV
jgi:putative nucleotidyltransferase with HDIG domain